MLQKSFLWSYMKGSNGVHSTPRRLLPHPRLRDCPCARHFAISSLLLSPSAPLQVSRKKKGTKFCGRHSNVWKVSECDVLPFPRVEKIGPWPWQFCHYGHCIII